MSVVRFATIITFALLLAYGAASAQEPAPSAKDLTARTEPQYCPHPGAIDRFEYIRVTPPADVVFFDGKMLDHVAQDRLRTKTLSFEVSPLTRLPENFGRDYKRRTYALIYCDHPDHKFLYEAIDVPVPRKR